MPGRTQPRNSGRKGCGQPGDSGRGEEWVRQALRTMVEMNVDLRRAGNPAWGPLEQAIREMLGWLDDPEMLHWVDELLRFAPVRLKSRPAGRSRRGRVRRRRLLRRGDWRAKGGARRRRRA